MVVIDGEPFFVLRKRKNLRGQQRSPKARPEEKEKEKVSNGVDMGKRGGRGRIVVCIMESGDYQERCVIV